MAYLANNFYTGDGTTSVFTFSFDVISSSDVRLEIDGEVINKTDLTYPWQLDSLTSPSQVEFTGSVPSLGAEVRIYRDTPRSDVYKVFTNEPLNNEDLTNSFKKLLFIEQEGRDAQQLAEDLFDSAGVVPAPTDDDQFLISEDGTWQVRSSEQALEALGLNQTADAVFNSVTSDEITTGSLSATSATISYLEASGFVNTLALDDVGQDFNRVLFENANAVYLNANGYHFKVDNVDRWRIEKTPLTQVLHNYGDSLPPEIQEDSTAIGLALSGQSKVIAHNTTKGWASVSGTGGTPGLNTDAPLFGVSAVSKIGTGQYRISYDSNVFPDSSTTKNLILIPKLYTTTNGQRMVGIADRQNTYFDVSIYDNTTLVDNDFTVEMF